MSLRQWHYGLVRDEMRCKDIFDCEAERLQHRGLAVRARPVH